MSKKFTNKKASATASDVRGTVTGDITRKAEKGVIMSGTVS